MLDNIQSIINGDASAADNLKPFTYIEFIKLGGLDNEKESFTDLYTEYLKLWASSKKYNSKEDIDDFVRNKMVDLLKSITITYTSYEEKDFIANLDWSDDEHIKAVIPFYIRKIREITEFYREKRNNISQIVRKNSFYGSTKSIEEIIYDAIFNFAFAENYDIQIREIRRDILVSIENYVDTYSEYFDIPRDNPPTNESRKAMLSANMNDVDYRNYLEVNQVVADLIYGGYVYLKEIPLIARVAMDLSQNCVGDMADLKNALLAAATINQVELTEQIALRRRLYEKFLGCDLYYLYSDDNKNVQMDLLVKAGNPSGNLLNCGTADTATVESGQLELLSHIGLFFKPDKTGILKINTKNFTWEVDEENLLPSTMYVFPDPSKYGQIGNNKESTYPLIMDYRLDANIKNMSSGFACNDPLLLLDEPALTAYYSKQQDDFKLFDNKEFEYAFTALENRGYVYDTQKDIYGNHFALFKGFSVEYEDSVDESTGETTRVPSKVYISSKYGNADPKDAVVQDSSEENSRALIINGGYFEDPNFPGRYDGDTYIPGKPFDHTKKARINENYHWMGIKLSEDPNFLVRPAQVFNILNFGTFDQKREAIYHDDYLVTRASTLIPTGSSDNSIIDELVDGANSELIDNNTANIDGTEVEIVPVEKSFFEIQEETGTLVIKDISSMDKKPYSILKGFPWLARFADKDGNLNVKAFQLVRDVICLELSDKIVFVPFLYNGCFEDNTQLKRMIVFEAKEGSVYARPLYVEQEASFYVLRLDEYVSENGKVYLPSVTKVDTRTYTTKEVLSSVRFLETLGGVSPKTRGAHTYSEFEELIWSDEQNFINFKAKYGDESLKNLVFSYNGNLHTFLLTYVYQDGNNNPYIYEHKFKLLTDELFYETVVSNVYSFGERNYFFSEKVDSGYSESVVGGTESTGSYFFQKVWEEA